MKFMQKYWAELQQLHHLLAESDSIIIGAGAGLSTSAGYTYSGERFQQHFADFEKTFGFHDMYSGGFYHFPSPEIRWAYWSRNIYINRYTPPPFPLYDRLLTLVRDKDYFVLTTNVDHCFQRAGFDKKRLFYTQGDYGLFQCSVPCSLVTYDNEEQVKAMINQQEQMKIPSALIPHCPRCGAPMTMNLRSDSKFVEDEGWHEAAGRYSDFLSSRKGQRILFLELGVGFNTPGIIKLTFWQMTMENDRAAYAAINLSDTDCPDEIRDRAVLLNVDIKEAINALCNIGVSRE